MNVDKLMREIDQIDYGHYSASCNNLIAIHDAARGWFEMAFCCFGYGFIKGQRSIKAEAKKGTDYGELLRLIPKLKNNERLLRIVLRFVQNLTSEGGQEDANTYDNHRHPPAVPGR